MKLSKNDIKLITQVIGNLLDDLQQCEDITGDNDIYTQNNNVYQADQVIQFLNNETPAQSLDLLINS